MLYIQTENLSTHTHNQTQTAMVLRHVWPLGHASHILVSYQALIGFTTIAILNVSKGKLLETLFVGMLLTDRYCMYIYTYTYDDRRIGST